MVFHHNTRHYVTPRDSGGEKFASSAQHTTELTGTGAGLELKIQHPEGLVVHQRVGLDFGLKGSGDSPLGEVTGPATCRKDQTSKLPATWEATGCLPRTHGIHSV